MGQHWGFKRTCHDHSGRRRSFCLSSAIIPLFSFVWLSPLSPISCWGAGQCEAHVHVGVGHDDRVDNETRPHPPFLSLPLRQRRTRGGMCLRPWSGGQDRPLKVMSEPLFRSSATVKSSVSGEQSPKGGDCPRPLCLATCNWNGRLESHSPQARTTWHRGVTRRK